MKKIVKMMFALLAMILVLAAFKGQDAKATDSLGDISVTVPTKMDITFNEDGTTSASEFYLKNDSLVPVEVKNVTVEEFNEWEVVPSNCEILVNTKRLSLRMGDVELDTGSNAIHYTVPEGTKYDFNVSLKRGAWTQSIASEKALEFEVDYELGTKEFALTLNRNDGGDHSILYVKNGDVVTLETPTREGYQFNGWKDSDGNVHSDEFVMPIGDATLTALWKQKVAYAIYVESDSSLRFVRTSELLYDGCTYNGMTVTKVYKGFENASYSSLSNVPWYDYSFYNKRIIKKVIVQDKIQPVSTAYWFAYMADCEYLDLTKLDTSKTTNMSSMFMNTGTDVSVNMNIYGVDALDTSSVTDMSNMFDYTGLYANGVSVNLSKWNVTNVTNMQRMFAGMGYYSKVFNLGDLSNWDVSKVTNMDEMFKETGFRATWSLDCSGWNVSQVISAINFKYKVESKVTEPQWVY